MNTIKIYLAESGRVADLRKDFPLFQGQYNDKLLNIFVPTSLLAPKFDIQHYIGQTTVSTLPTDDELASFVAYNTPTHREPETGDIVEIYDVSTSKYWLYIYGADSWTSTEVDSFGSFTNISGTSIKIGCYATQRNGLIYQSKSYFVRYLKTLTYNNIEYALYERKLPKEFTKFVGEGVNAVKIVANVVNIDAESNTITSLITSQSCSLEVLPSSILDKDETIEASDLERLEAQVSENSSNIALKQNKTDPSLNTTNKTVVGAINELNTQVTTNTSNIGTLTNELPLKQDKTDPMLATTNKTVVGAINELNTQVGLNTGNISENAGDISDLQRRISSLEDIAITGETYIGSMSGTELPTDSQLNSYVLSETGREPDGGDYIYFTLNISGETDKNYKYIYSDVTGWSNAELPGVEKASNFEYGIVKGSYSNMSSGDKLTAISIADGQMDEIFVKDTTLTTPEWKTLPNYVNGVKTQVNTNTNNISTNAGNIAQNTLDIQANYNSIGTINGNINNIIDGTTTVGSAVKATNDGLNRNIAQTYLTQNAGATKTDLYNYALPRTFNDVLFLNANNMYTDSIPVSSSALYTATSSSVGATTLFFVEDEITSPVGSSFQLSSKNSYTNTFYVTASDDCSVSYRLNTEIDLNGATETLNIELTDSIEMVSGQIKKISLGSTFNYLDNVLNVTPGAIITQTLEVITDTSSPITFSVYSNETYPSTFYLNTTSMVLTTQQGVLGELPVYELQGNDTLNADIEFIMTDVPETDTYAHFKLNYSKTGNTPIPDNYKVAFYLPSANQYMKFYTPLNYGTNDLLTIGDINQGFYDYNIGTNTISFTWEFDGFIQQINGEFVVNTVIPTQDTGALGIKTFNIYESIIKSLHFTTTDDFVGWYVDVDDTKTLVTLANKDSLGIIPGTTRAFCKTNGGIAENQAPMYDTHSRTIYAYNTHQFMDKSDIEYTLSTTSNNPIANRIIARLIPAQASASNQLADKDFVNSSINNLAAYYITKNAIGDPFSTKAELTGASTYYSGGSARVPTNNDYCIVIADTSQATSVSGYTSFTTTDEYIGYYVLYNNESTLVNTSNKDSVGITAGTTVPYISIPTTRYTYQGSQWEFQYIINNTSLTANQIAALNSGITSSLVTKLNGIEAGAEVNDVTDIQINGSSILSGTTANIITNTAYNSSSNKIATMTDLSTKANKTIIADYTLLANGWLNNAQTLNITGKTASNNARVSNSNTGTDANVLANGQAIAAANIYKIVDNGTSLTFICENVPTDNLIIQVEVFE